MKFRLLLSIFLLGILTFSLVSCFDQQLEKNETVYIKHYPSIIVDDETSMGSLALQVQFEHQKGKDEWTLVPIDAIEGFDYTMGVNYEIEIKKAQEYDEDLEAYMIKYHYLYTIKETKVTETETFEIPLKSENFEPNNLVSHNSGSGYSLLGKLHIFCFDDCQELEEALNTNNEVTGVFRHEDNENIRLIQLK
ncbi:DUF4377 domain-containing protein [Echinicola pacifica]|uniref:DUF4377 domain-containing protein n=1 Tax=Echinicola pacifica TaxID=346377 RepID=UPI0012F81EE5|nr:DUF4377 domain-containing protein [Echinicola pacifica]